MSPDEAPNGTICAVGHPANGVVARKGDDGVWYYIHLGLPVPIDEVYRSMTALWIPE